MPRKHKRKRKEAFTASLAEINNETDNNNRETTHKTTKKRRKLEGNVNPDKRQVIGECNSTNNEKEVIVLSDSPDENKEVIVISDSPDEKAEEMILVSSNSPVTKHKKKKKKSKHKTNCNVFDDRHIYKEKVLVGCRQNKRASVDDLDSGHEGKRRKKKHKFAKENEGDREIIGKLDYTVTKGREGCCSGRWDGCNLVCSDPPKRKHKKKTKKKEKNIDLSDPKMESQQRDNTGGLPNNKGSHSLEVEGKQKQKRCHNGQEKVDGCLISHPVNLETVATCSTWRKEKGKKYTTGRWSKRELEIIDRNLKRIGESIEAVDLDADLYKDVRLKNGSVIQWEELLKTTHFYDNMQHGLNRVKLSVFRLLFYTKQSFEKNGPFNKKEVKKLKKLHFKYGNKWRLIGKQMGRNYNSVQSKMLYHLKGINRGPWSDEEIEKLRHAVQVLTETEEGTPIYKNIDWSIASIIVETRNGKQCQRKWSLNPSSTLRLLQAPRWSTIDNVALIESIYNSDASHEVDIEWDMIYSSWQNSSVVSPLRLSTKWSALKYKYLTNPRNMEFEEIIDELYHVVLPQLKSEIEHEKKCIKDSKKRRKRKLRKQIKP